MSEPTPFPPSSTPAATVTRTVRSNTNAPTPTVSGARPNPTAPAPVAAEQRTASTLAAMPVGQGVNPRHDPAEAREAPKPEAGDKLSQRLALLAKREADLVRKQRSWSAEVQRRETAIKNQSEQLESLRHEVDEFKGRIAAAKTDPLKWLAEGGFDYDTATKAALNDGNLPAEEVVKRETANLKGEIEKLRKEQADKAASDQKAKEEAETQARAANERSQREAYGNFVKQARDYANTNKAQYPLINMFHAEGDIAQLIDAHFRATAQQDLEVAKREGRMPMGKVLSFEEASKYLEQFYRDQVAAGYKAIAGESAAAAQPQPPPVVSGAAPVAPQNENPGQRPAISNSVVTSVSPASGAALSEAERYKRALERLSAPGAVRDQRPA